MTNKLFLNKIGGVATVIGTTFVFATLLVASPAQALVNTAMSIGSTGGEVSNLQQFLATSPSIYPRGIVSGYFGGLTQAAVGQFQVNYGLVKDGRVSGVTQSMMNTVMSSGLGLDISAPAVWSYSLQVNRNDATVNLGTSEFTKVQVFYDTNPIRADESSVMRSGLGYVSGNQASYTGDYKNSHSVVISNLQTNTNYYYFVRAIDMSGNVTVLTNGRFQTNN